MLAPRPPTFHCGWIVDTKYMLQQAASRGVQILQREEHYSSGWDGSRGVTVKYSIDEPATIEEVAAVILEDELRVNLPSRSGSYIKLAVGPGSKSCPVFSLYDNYHITKQPGEADVAKVQNTFGFTGEPQWYPSCLEFSWKFPVFVAY